MTQEGGKKGKLKKAYVKMKFYWNLNDKGGKVMKAFKTLTASVLRYTVSFLLEKKEYIKLMKKQPRKTMTLRNNDKTDFAWRNEVVFSVNKIKNYFHMAKK